jgi:hypothetical protein
MGYFGFSADADNCTRSRSRIALQHHQQSEETRSGFGAFDSERTCRCRCWRMCKCRCRFAVVVGFGLESAEVLPRRWRQRWLRSLLFAVGPEPVSSACPESEVRLLPRQGRTCSLQYVVVAGRGVDLVFGERHRFAPCSVGVLEQQQLSAQETVPLLFQSTVLFWFSFFFTSAFCLRT